MGGGEKDLVPECVPAVMAPATPLSQRPPGDREMVPESATATLDESELLACMVPGNPQDEESAHPGKTIAGDGCLEPHMFQEPIAAIAERMDKSVQTTKGDAPNELAKLRDEAADLERQLHSQEAERSALIERVRILEASLD